MNSNRIEGIKTVFSLLEGNSFAINYESNAYKRFLAHVTLGVLLLMTGGGLLYLVATNPNKALIRNFGLGLILVGMGFGLILHAFLLKKSLDSSILFTKELIILDNEFPNEIKWSELESVKCFPGSVTFIGKSGVHASVNVLSKKFTDFVKLIDIGTTIYGATGKDALYKKIDAEHILSKLCSN